MSYYGSVRPLGEVLAAWGVQLPDKLPAGWKREILHDGDVVFIVDDRERTRLMLYGDREPIVSTRFHPAVIDRTYTPRVYDGAVVRWQGEPRKGRGFAQFDAAMKEAVQWLDRHYPEWKDPLAYWEGP